MGIQNSINQMLGTGLIAGGLFANSPAGKRMVEQRQAKINASRSQARIQAIQSKQELSEVDKQELESAITENREAAQTSFRLNPNKYTLTQLNKTYSMKTPSEIAAQLAENSMQERQISRQAQKDILKERKDR